MCPRGISGRSSFGEKKKAETRPYWERIKAVVISGTGRFTVSDRSRFGVLAFGCLFELVGIALVDILIGNLGKVGVPVA